MNFLNPLLPQIQETAWESLLLGKAVWGKQGCTLCLLINTNLPAQTQNFAGENDQKELEEEMKEQSSCQALPSSPPCQECLAIATRNISFVLQQFIPSWCQRHRQITLEHQGKLGAGDISASLHQQWQGWNSISFQLCCLSQDKDTNVSFWARPAGAVFIRLLLLFSSLPFSTQASFMEHTTCVHFSFTEIQQINLEFWHIST